MQDVIWKHRIHPGAEGTPPSPQGGFFVNRLQAGTDQWSTYKVHRQNIGNAPQPFSWDVAPLPANKAKAAIGGAFAGWAVPKDLPRKEYGWTLARFIAFTLETQLDVAEGLGVPPLKEAGEKAFGKLTDPRNGRRALLEPIEKGYAFKAERFSFPKWQELVPTADREIGAVLRNERVLALPARRWRPSSGGSAESLR